MQLFKLPGAYFLLILEYHIIRFLPDFKFVKPLNISILVQKLFERK